MKDKYDVIIIGAGIGGLVCGCYLAKSGVKTLIIEKNHYVGGYCTSFRRNGYSFDAAVHYLGGGRTGGEIRKIINDLSLCNYMRISRLDPSEKIVTPDKTIYIRSSPAKTIEEFNKDFPKEIDKINRFFQFILKSDFYYLYSKLRKITFKALLDMYFKNDILKSILSIPLGNIGLPPSRASALASTYLFREFIMDPGYYPTGGLQSFSNALAKSFESNGGSISLNSKGKRVLIRDNVTYGIILDNNKKIEAKIVISDCDADLLFNTMIEGKNILRKNYIKLEPTPSCFAVYLGLAKDLKKDLPSLCSIWYFTTYDIEDCYGNIYNNIKNRNINYLLCTFPSLHDNSLAPFNKTTMEIFICAPFINEEYWKNNKEIICEAMIKRAQDIVSNLFDSIELKIIASPATFRKYTLNQRGAMYGWAATPQQIDQKLFPQKTSIENLYMVGHWCTSWTGQGGIPTVTRTGRIVANKVLRRLSKIKI